MSEGEERTRRDGPAVGGLSDDEVLARLRAIPRVGRFTILRPLGEGGMGTVSVAYDEELDRKVALKMIRGRYADSAELRERFLREARALARLSHPNVVTIYEVGEDLGAPFLAMELVEGVDLRTWLRSGERSRAAITRVMIEAGRGLAAAHAAGIVHRDFKPQNVLVADDGRPRVVDFGLARELAPSGAADDGAEGAGRRLTVNGAILGTPPYMPREQLFGLDVDARCDVYAFGVTLYEALVGRRPFSGRTLAERRKEVAYPPAIDTRGLSARLVRVLTRALAEAPDERYPSMDALLRDLSADPYRWWRRAVSAVVAGVATAGVVYVGVTHDPCDARAELDGVWDASVAAELRAALDDGGGEGGERVVDELGDYASAWARSRRQLCEGEFAAGERSVRARCLDEQRLRLMGFIDLLRSDDLADVDRALESLKRLPAPSTCVDQALPRHGAAPPQSAAAAAESDALRRELGKAELGGTSADRVAALARVDAVASRARALGDRILESDALTLSGRLLAHEARYEEAALRLEEAVWVAAAADDPERISQALSSLVYDLGDSLRDDARAARWRPYAGALVERIGATSLANAQLSWAFGIVDMRHGRLDAALALLLRSVVLRAALVGPRSLAVAQMLSNLGAVLGARRSFGPSLLVSQWAVGILEENLGPDHLSVIVTLSNIANMQRLNGSITEALATLRDALRRSQRGLGEEHPQTAFVRLSIGQVLLEIDAFAEAREELTRSADVIRKRLGKHPELLHRLEALVEADLGLEDIPGARARAAELVDVAREVPPPRAEHVLNAFITAADVEKIAGAPAAARDLADEGLALAGDDETPARPYLRDYLRYFLAWALHELGDPRAAEVATLARDGLAERRPELFAEEIVELDRWRAPAKRGERRRRATRRSPR